MLYWLTALSDGGDFWNLFRYITFRAGGAFFTALVFGFLFGPRLILFLRTKQTHGQPIRADGPEGHFSKAGTPTMGGVLILRAEYDPIPVVLGIGAADVLTALQSGAPFGAALETAPEDFDLGTLLNLATCHEKLGRTASAWGEFKEAATLAEKRGEKDRATFANEHLAKQTLAMFSE